MLTRSILQVLLVAIIAAAVFTLFEVVKGDDVSVGLVATAGVGAAVGWLIWGMRPGSRAS